jgi:hypothetical protein
MIISFDERSGSATDGNQPVAGETIDRRDGAALMAAAQSAGMM